MLNVHCLAEQLLPQFHPRRLRPSPRGQRHFGMQQSLSHHYATLPSLKLRKHTHSEDDFLPSTVVRAVSGDATTPIQDSIPVATASSNGDGQDIAAASLSGDSAQAEAGQLHEPELLNKIHALEEVVQLQRDLLKQQQQALEQLQQKLEISQPRPALARTQTLPMVPPKAPDAGSVVPAVRPFDAQRRAGYGDRRYLGLYDARFHSTAWGATPRDFRILPRRIILVRHGESMGNVDHHHYTYVPDPQVPLSELGYEQAIQAGQRIRTLFDADGLPYKLFFYYSPYLRSKQTFEGIVSAFDEEHVAGAQEEVQIREQDFGNFQDATLKQKEKAERLRFGRFFYRFPNGESGADVYDRITIFEDHMIRDINAGRFSNDTSLVLVTHGLATRVFLMRWFHWTVDQFLKVYNPPNAEPIVLERITGEHESYPGGPASWTHTKALYRLQEHSKLHCRGVTDDMCQIVSRRRTGLAVQQPSKQE